MKTVQMHYYAIFREQRGQDKESLSTEAATLLELYEELTKKFGFTLPRTAVKPAVNDEFVQWQRPLKNGDRVTFIPPVAGG